MVTCVSLAAFLSHPVISEFSVQIPVFRLPLLTVDLLRTLSCDLLGISFLVSFDESLLERSVGAGVVLVALRLVGTVVSPVVPRPSVASVLFVLELHICSKLLSGREGDNLNDSVVN